MIKIASLTTTGVPAPVPLYLVRVPQLRLRLIGNSRTFAVANASRTRAVIVA